MFADPANLGAHRPLYAARRDELRGWMADAGLRWIVPEGAFYAMVGLPPRLAGDSLAAAEALLERHRVLATPGVAFGESGEGWLRLSWVAEAGALREGIGRIAEFFREGAP